MVVHSVLLRCIHPITRCVYFDWLIRW